MLFGRRVRRLLFRFAMLRSSTVCALALVIALTCGCNFPPSAPAPSPPPTSTMPTPEPRPTDGACAVSVICGGCADGAILCDAVDCDGDVLDEASVACECAVEVVCGDCDTDGQQPCAVVDCDGNDVSDFTNACESTRAKTSSGDRSSQTLGGKP